MKPGDVLQEHQRDAALVAQLDEVRALERRLAEQDAVVGEDPDRIAPDVGEAAHQRLAVERLELVRAASRRRSAGCTSRTSYGRARVGRHEVVELGGVLSGGPRAARDCERPARGRGGRASRTIDRRIASASASSAARWSTTPERRACTSPPPRSSARDDLAGGRLHERRAAEEDRALVPDDHRLVGHRRHVGAARRARAHARRRAAGCPAADICAWLKKIRPKWSRSGNTSSCIGRNAPPESTR